jgi:hypothetical protein
MRAQAFESSAEAFHALEQKTGALAPFAPEKPSLELVKVTKDLRVGGGFESLGGAERPGTLGLAVSWQGCEKTSRDSRCRTHEHHAGPCCAPAEHSRAPLISLDGRAASTIIIIFIVS